MSPGVDERSKVLLGFLNLYSDACFLGNCSKAQYLLKALGTKTVMEMRRNQKKKKMCLKDAKGQVICALSCPSQKSVTRLSFYVLPHMPVDSATLIPLFILSLVPPHLPPL